MEEEYSKVCQQCAGLADSLAECEGGCGRELCSYCQPKCHECSDREKTEQIEEEEREEKRRKREAKKKGFQPKRTTGEKVGRALDWLTGLSDGALRRELEYYDGEFDKYDSDAVQEMIKARWKHLPGWKKKLYKVKKKSEDMALKTAYKVGTKGGRIIGSLGRPGGLLPDFSTLKSEKDDQDFEDDNQDYENDDIQDDDEDFEDDDSDHGEEEDEEENEED